MIRQTTISRPVEIHGQGLFGGQPSCLRFVPAGPDTGLVFCRTDRPEPVRIPALLKNLAFRARRTSLMKGSTTIETVEHVLAAITGMGVHNLLIEVDGEECPSIDGSSLPFAHALQEAEITEVDTERQIAAIDDVVACSEGPAMIAALPGNGDCLEIIFHLDYSDSSIGRQVLAYRLGKDDFVKELAPARTFLVEQEAKAFVATGFGEHLTTHDILIYGPTGIIGNISRFTDEPVRHKVIDFIGDLSLLGKTLVGRIICYQSSHELNHQLLRTLSRRLSGPKRRKRVFISYKYEDPVHNKWVERLYTDLRTQYAIDATIDKFGVPPGGSLSRFMSEGIRKADYAILVITPSTRKAIDAGKGGVAFETQIINARRISTRHMNFLIPILRSGSKMPGGLSDDKYIDFRSDKDYEDRLKELALWILGQIEPPPCVSAT